MKGAYEGTHLLENEGSLSRLRQKLRDPKLVVPLSVVFYMICSASMSLVNKIVTRQFQDLPVTVTEIQMLFAAVCLPTLFYSTLHIGSRSDAIRWCFVIPLAYSSLVRDGS